LIQQLAADPSCQSLKWWQDTTKNVARILAGEVLARGFFIPAPIEHYLPWDSTALTQAQPFQLRDVASSFIALWLIGYSNAYPSISTELLKMAREIYSRVTSTSFDNIFSPCMAIIALTGAPQKLREILCCGASAHARQLKAKQASNVYVRRL